MRKGPIKIAILGTRGIPARYGGFETFAEELGTRLAERGYDVSVYCRDGNGARPEASYKGVRLVTLPTIRHKYFETVFHTFLSSLHVMFCKADIVYYCNAINSIFMVFPRLAGKKVLINVDGLEWKRAKWNRLGKWAYIVSEYIATILAHVVIADSRRIAVYYKKKFKKDTILISYGSTGVIMPDTTGVLARYGLEPRKYLLYVSRLEPENNAHLFVRGYEKVRSSQMPFVIVGHAPYGSSYVKNLQSTRDERIRFLGPVYGDDYRVLLSHAYLYLHGNEVGGTNPALLEAMATGNCVLAKGVGFNRHVIGDAGFWFKHKNAEDLVRQLEYLIVNPAIVEACRPRAIARMKKYYQWDDVAGQYDRLFRGMIARPPKTGPLES